MDELTQTEPKKKGRRPGIYSWLRTGRVNPSIRGHKALQTYLMNLERELIEMQGPGGMTVSKEILIKSTIEGFGVLLMAAMFCKREGVIRPDLAKQGVIELQPVLGKQFLAFMNTIRQNLMALGLERRGVEDVLDLGRYLEAKAKNEKASLAVDKGAAEKTQPARDGGQGRGGEEGAQPDNEQGGTDDPGPEEVKS